MYNSIKYSKIFKGWEHEVLGVGEKMLRTLN